MKFFNEPLTHARENDLGYIRPWHRLANFLGVIPFADWRKSPKFSILTKIKLCSILSANTLLFAFFVYTKFTESFYTDKKRANAVLSIASASLTFFPVAINFIKLGFSKRKHYHAFLVKVDLVDANLKMTRFQTETRLQFYSKALLLHVLVFTASALVLSYMGFFYSKYIVLIHLTKEFEIYYITVLIALIYNYIACIGVRFKKVNLELKKVPLERTQRAYLGVRRLTKIYFELLDVLRLFNLVFGWQLLVIAARLVVDSLFLLSAGVLLGIFQTVRWSVAATSTFVLKTSLSWTLIVLLTTACKQVTKEVRKTMVVGYKLMQDLRSKESSPSRRLVHEELFLLMQEIYSTAPHVSAAGFFPVDYSLLLTCMSCISSYVIVLIQLNK